MRRCGKLLKERGSSLNWLPDRSSLISEEHLLTVLSSLGLMLVPARMSSLREAGSLMNSLICSSYSVFCCIRSYISPNLLSSAKLSLVPW